MATWESNNYGGRIIRLTITETVEPVNNRSKLDWTISSVGGSSSYYSIAATSISIDGMLIHSIDRTGYSTHRFPSAKGSVSGTYYVNHNADGKKTISVSFKTRVYYDSDPQEYGGSMTLTTIDRNPPKVTFVASNITSDSIQLTAYSDATANLWEYSLNGGGSYTQFSTASGMSASTAVSGLIPNETYHIRVRARRSYNNVSGESDVSDVTTLGASRIISAPTVVADDNPVTTAFQITTYNASYYHRLCLAYSGGAVFEIEIGQLPIGTSSKTITLSSSQRNALLMAITGKSLQGAHWMLYTYDGSDYSGQIGSAVSYDISVITTEEKSKPYIAGFTYRDTDNAVTSVTGNDQILVQNCSFLEVMCEPGVEKNGAKIAGYSVSAGDVSKTGSSPVISVGKINSETDISLTVRCFDTRDYSTAIAKTVKVLPYSAPKIKIKKLRREDEVGERIQLELEGSYTSLYPDGEADVNGIARALLYYKRTSENEWSDAISILSSVSAADAKITLVNDDVVSLSSDYSYDIRIEISDKLGEYGTVSVEASIPKGTPLLALRSETKELPFMRVGINNPDPKYMLDVAGSVSATDLNAVGRVTATGLDITQEGGQPVFRTDEQGNVFVGNRPLSELFVPPERTVNGKALRNDVTLSASDVNAVAEKNFPNYYSDDDSTEANFNAWLDIQLDLMGNQSVKSIQFTSYPAVSGNRTFGLLFKNDSSYASLLGFSYNTNLLLKIKNGGAWQNTRKISFS